MLKVFLPVTCASDQVSLELGNCKLFWNPSGAYMPSSVLTGGFGGVRKKAQTNVVFAIWIEHEAAPIHFALKPFAHVDTALIVLAVPVHATALPDAFVVCSLISAVIVAKIACEPVMLLALS